MKIDILTLAGGSPSGAALMIDTFDAARRLDTSGSFDPSVRFVSPSPSPVLLRGGLSIEAEPLALQNPANATIALGIGAAAPEEIDDRLRWPDAGRAVEWLRHRANRGHICAACTGVFLLGEAGLLSKRRATTTWWLAGQLAKRYGAIVDADQMIVADGELVTAGGATGHLDLALSVVAALGTEALASETANRLAGSLGRSQGQFVSASGFAVFDPLIARIEEWAGAFHRDRLSVARLAEDLAIHPRTLQRHVRAATGRSTSWLLQKLVLERAVRIAAYGAPLATVSERSGLSDASVLHRLAKRHTGRTPGQLRRRS